MKRPPRQGRPDIEPILKAIVRTAARLCDARYAHLHLVDGDRLAIAAKHGRLPRTLSLGESLPLSRGSVAGRAVVDRRTVHVRDLKVAAKSQYPDAAGLQRAAGLRTMLATPLVQDGRAVGALVVLRTTVRPFTAHQIALLKTFAEQAAIALENARLSRELEARNSGLSEALEQQTATADILGVISSSPTNVQPVLDAVAENSARLCGALFASVYLFDGKLIDMRAQFNYPALALERSRQFFPTPPHRRLFTGRAILDRALIHVPDVLADPEFVGQDFASEVGFRSVVSVPMLRDGHPIGAITVWHAKVGAFTDRQVALLRTFADQAVIAIENVRLFTELGARNHDLSESLEQQTATSEILRVISSSPTDLQPVFDIIAESAVKLCGAEVGLVTRLEAEWVEVKAVYGTSAVGREAIRRVYPMRPSGAATSARAIRDCAIAHIPDVLAEEGYGVQEAAVASGFRSALGVPMVREGRAIGSIAIGRAEAGEFSERQIKLLCTFADQAVIAIENVRLFTELGARNRDLTESLEQQTATSEILQVISSSPTDLQPVFDIIAESAVKLCGAEAGLVSRLEGEWVEVKAVYGSSSAGADALRRAFPMRPTGVGAAARAIRDRAIAHIPDVLADEGYRIQEAAVAGGFRAVLAVPMLREGRAIGSVGIGRSEPGAFSERQIRLLQTFADQALIAIENVRLFTELGARNQELTDSLTQQTATAEILRVISSSPTDIQPVLDAVLESAARLCEAVDSLIFLQTGDELRVVAHRGAIRAGPVGEYTVPIGRGTVNGRAMLEARTVHVDDLAAESREFPEGSAIAREMGHRTVLVVPLMREGVPLGTIAVRRAEVRPFSERQIALLQTFADQAVIAIENVRLFTELGERNRDLTEALGQQTATSEILRVISQSPTDVQPVFDTIAERAMRLCGGAFGWVFTFDGEMLRLAALANVSPEGADALRQAFPVPLSRGTGAGRAILTGDVVPIPDVLDDPEYEQKNLARAADFRSGLSAPMLHQGRVIGVISVTRREPGAFSQEQIRLLRTFADQAVIAIENVRLFTELQASNRDLTTALDKQTATSEILRVISRSQTDVQPVFDAILGSAVRLLGGHTGVLAQVSGDQIELAAFTRTDAAGDASLRAIFPQSLHSEAPHAQVIRDRAPLNIADSHTDPRVPESVHASARARGYRSWVTVPLLRHGEAVGTIAVTRPEPGGFNDDEIALLKTFADQAVIAIENVRLFTELGARNHDLTESLEQQTATSEILRVISQSPTDVHPVFETIAKNARRLCRGDSASVLRLEGALLHLETVDNASVEGAEALRAAYPSPVSQGSAGGRAVLTGRAVHIPDVLEDPDYEFAALQGAGLRSMLSVPMLRHGIAIGAIVVHTWATARPFSGKQMELLQTFADQAVIAIENARLFKELQARTSELTRSVDQLTALGEISQAVSSTLDVETVLQTIVSRASQLAGADGCAIYEYDDATEVFHIRATHNLDPALVGTLRASPLRKGEGAMGRAAETREPTQVADIAAPGAYQSHIRDTLLGAGYRALLSVPLLREGEIIGSLSLNRYAPGEFPAEAVEVLKTFATQSALAIQNARLFREIADQSRLLEAASRHKSEFLANMSHELRTPLNAIIGFSEVLNERMFGELNDKQAEYLKDIHASGTHLLSLINDILDLSKVEAGRMELELSTFSLPAAIDSALTLVRERATRRGVALHASIHHGIGEMSGDERKIRQVLLNLLSNAIKFTPEGGRIEVTAAPENGAVDVSVIDTGVGIAPEDHEAVFEEFRQVGESAAKQEGTGLGLALCRKFVELHGGKIWVTSALGAGSTFTFRLPVRS